MPRGTAAALAGSLFATAALAQAPEVPAELAPFIEKGARALAVESADLDRDGTKDYVLVLEKVDAKGEPVEAEEGQRPLLVIVLKKGETATKEDILGFMQGKVAKWWMPDDVVFVDEIPHTATGKIQKMTLRKQFEDYRLPGVQAAE